MKKLYTISVESEFVFASDSHDTREVEREFRQALLRDFSMADELEQGDVQVSKMAHLPGDYTREALPWEGERADDEPELTIGEMIDAGAAPEYTKRAGEGVGGGTSGR